MPWRDGVHANGHDLEIDISTVILRIEQACMDPAMVYPLLNLMLHHDVPRLTQYLSVEARQRIQHIKNHYRTT